MGAPGSLNTAKVYGDTIEYVSRWTIGASGAHTKVFGKGFSGVAETAAGKYTITFTEVPFGPIVDCTLTHWAQADTEQLVLAPREGTYDAAAKTLKYEAWAVDDTPAQTEIPSGDEVSICVRWLKTV